MSKGNQIKKTVGDRRRSLVGKLTFTLLAPLAFLYSGNVYSGDADRPRLERRALNVSQRVGTALDRNMNSMSNRELRQFIKASRSAIQIARGRGDGGNGGGGNDDGNHGGGGVLLSISIEGSGMALESSNSLENLRMNCINKIQRASRGKADDLTVRVSGGKTVSRTTSGWWNTAKEKCSAIIDAAVESAASVGVKLSHKRYVLTGQVEGHGLIAEGNSLNELESSCRRINAFSGNMDSMTVSLNGGPKRYKSTSGWWRTTDQVCNAAMSVDF